MMHKRILITLFSSAAMLSACGGGGGGEAPAPAPSPTDAVPDSASASMAGMKSYLMDLSTMQVEDKEPVDLSRFAPPSADDSEPETIS
ncbi:MAG TPA: hypothetical protein VF169_06825 [Albitalea sp.]|uniref:hypothetical protein n=1 Tax=Piscinibacter sp. TaxID=1903157 RepID=UPI002ED31BAC